MKTRKNIMGTISFAHRFPRMRKEQDFIVYPIKATDDLKNVLIQSDTRIGRIDLATGKGIMSAPHQNGAHGVQLQMDIMKKKAVPFELDHEDLFVLRSAIRETAGFEVGESIVKTDNVGAIQA